MEGGPAVNSDWGGGVGGSLRADDQKFSWGHVACRMGDVKEAFGNLSLDFRREFWARDGTL